MNKIIRSVAYIRVSTNKAEQKTSYATQTELFQPIAHQNGEIFLEVYGDEGDTGTLLDNRDNFERMLYDAGIDIIKHTYNGKTITNFIASKREPKFDKIYIKNTSRFARNTLSKQIINELKKKHVSIFFYEQNIDTLTNQSMILDFYQTFDEWESKDKSQKVRTAYEKAEDQNVIRTNKRIYGYKYYPFIKDDRNNPFSNRLVAIPHEAEVVQLIFNLYANGKGIRAIVKELAKREIKTRDGNNFSKSTIGNILDNEKYCGQNQYAKWSAGYVFEKHPIRKNDTYKVQENERIDPIISVELFNKCKKIRQNNTDNKRGKTNNMSMFYKRIKCGLCNVNYNADNYDGKRVYRCPTRKFQGVEACNNHYVYESACIEFATSEQAKKAVIEHIRNRINSINRHIKDNQYLMSMKDDADSLKAFEEAQKLSLLDEKEQATRELAIVFTRLRTHQISQSEHDILADELTKRIKSINEQINNIKGNNFQTLVDIENEIFEIDALKNAINKITKKEEYIIKHIHMLIVDGQISVNMEDTIQSILHDIFE